MIQTFLLSSVLLTIPAQADRRAPSVLGGRPAPKANATAKAAPKADPAPKAVPAEASAAALAKYNEMKEKTPRTVAAQSKLAAWCEEHGLKAEAYVHYAAVVRLDPRREAAWRKLGYRKYGNRWMTEAQIAEAEDQKKADRVWAPSRGRFTGTSTAPTGPRSATWRKRRSMRSRTRRRSPRSTASSRAAARPTS